MIIIAELIALSGLNEPELRRVLENAGLGLGDHGPAHEAQVKAFIENYRRGRDVVSSSS
jgi:hypothetical protein